MFEIIVNTQLHTPYSDGRRYHADVAKEAARAGLQAVIATDHNVRVFGVEGYYGGVLLLTGEEVHNRRKESGNNHCLIYNCDEEMSPYGPTPQKLIDEVCRRGGMTFFSHPFRREPRGRDDRVAPCWTRWDVRNFTGIEIWNHQTEYKSWRLNFPITAFASLFPSLLISGPYRATLRKWDELTSGGRRIVGIGGSDAHGSSRGIGPYRRKVFPYEYAFRCVNTHMLIDEPLTGDAAKDKTMIYAAMQAGHCFVSYDLSAPGKGFIFNAQSGADQASMGDELPRRGAIHLYAECPSSGHIRLLRNGKPVAEMHGRILRHTTTDTGVYRVEVYRRFRALKRGWIFSNPIYVR
ncbi:MAG: CehA/McbA family metallohydrolase [Chloroflexi bacterium]|nr:CehA/McbA family metallohydrolase [Chloroflexota bacterium]MCL5274660.1 CehA/McbA family metallohydrolase [Chloroflexota bacterium]